MKNFLEKDLCEPIKAYLDDMLLYPEFDSAYFKEKRSGRHYYSKKK